MKLNEDELDALAEVINIGTGRAANSLSELTGSRIELCVPTIQVCRTSDFSEIAKTLDLEFGTTVQQGFAGDLSGQALLAFSRTKAFELARIVGGIPATDGEMDEELCGVLEEIGNIVLNAVLGSLANLLDCALSYTLPQLCTKLAVTTIVLRCAGDAPSSDSLVVVADSSITVASHDIRCSLLLVFETGDVNALLSALTAVPIR